MDGSLFMCSPQKSPVLLFTFTERLTLGFAFRLLGHAMVQLGSQMHHAELINFHLLIISCLGLFVLQSLFYLLSITKILIFKNEIIRTIHTIR